MTAQRHAISLIQNGYTTVQINYDTTAQVPPEVPDLPAVPSFEPKPEAPMPWQSGSFPPPPVAPRDGRAKIVPPKLYTFKAPKDAVKVGDLVVVNGSHGLTVARVHVVHDRPRIDLQADFDYQWIVDRVDLNGYKEKLAEEEKLRGVLQEAESQRQRKQLLEDLLSMYPEGSDARKLLDQANVADKVLNLPVNPEVLPE